MKMHHGHSLIFPLVIIMVKLIMLSSFEYLDSFKDQAVVFFFLELFISKLKLNH